MFLTATTNGRKGRFGVVQRLSAPRSGRYRIQAWGAHRGTHSSDYAERPGTYYGGKGAFKEGIFALTEGAALNIVVGQRGGDSVEVNGGQSTSKIAAEMGLSVEDRAGTGGWGGGILFILQITFFCWLPQGEEMRLMDIMGWMVRRVLMGPKAKETFCP